MGMNQTPTSANFGVHEKWVRRVKDQPRADRRSWKSPTTHCRKEEREKPPRTNVSVGGTNPQKLIGKKDRPKIADNYRGNERREQGGRSGKMRAVFQRTKK